MEKSKAEYFINKIYDWFYQNGYYDSNGVAQVCYILRKMFSYLNRVSNQTIDFDNINLVRTIFEKSSLDYIHPKFDNGVLPNEIIKFLSEIQQEPLRKIAKAINKLCDKNLTKPDALPTDEFSVKIMQAFAINISDNKSFVDICVGTGKLLANIDSQDILGIEVSPEYAEIAKANLFFSNKDYNVDYNIQCKDGLSYWNDHIERKTFIFDPPINSKISIDNYNSQLWHIKNYAKTNTSIIPSEYAFLYSILSKSNPNYVCMFSTNFLTSKESFKTTFREYLIHNSLQVVISLPNDNDVINKIILVGSQKRNNEYIYLVTPKTKNLNDTQLSRIIDICLRNKKYNEIKDYEIAKIRKIDIAELKENYYSINMPIYSKEEEKPKKILPLNKITTSLRTTNKKLLNESKKLETLLIEINAGIKHYNDLNNKNTQISNNKNNIKNVRKNIFKDLIQKYNNSNIDDKKRVIYLLFNTNNSTEKECINDINYLIKNNKLCYRYNRTFVYKNKQENNYCNYSNFRDFVFKTAKKRLDILSDSQKLFYKCIVDYYLSSTKKKKNEISEIFKNKYQTNDIYINLRMLEIIGLISKISNTEIYDYNNIQEITSSFNLFNNIIQTNQNTGETEYED